MRSFMIVIVLGLLAATADAQTGAKVAPDEEIQPHVGEQVRIRDVNGNERRGTLRGLRDGKLQLFTVTGGEITYSFDDIGRIDRRGDSLTNGLVIGALWPAVSLALGGAQGLDSTDGLVYQVPISIAMGALIGAGIDALHVGWTNVYRKRRDSRSAFIVAPARRGVRVALVRRF